MPPILLRALAVAASAIPLGIAAAAPYSTEVLADHPAGYYRFDEAAGSSVALDSSGLENHGDYVGPVTLGAPGLTAESGGALELSGAAPAYVRLPPLFNPALTSWTCEAIVRADSTPAANMVIVQQEDGGGDGRTFTFVHSSGVFRSFIGNAARDAGINLAAGEVFHTAFVFERTGEVGGEGVGTWRWYLNGAPAASGSVASPAGVESNAGTFVVGVHKNLTGSLWDGVIDEVALYTEALSPERIAAHYEAIAGPPLIESFSADDLNLPQGGATTLRWQVDPAVAALTLDPGGIDALALSDAGQGSYGVAPAASQTYTLTAQDAEGGAQAATVSVFVAEPVAFRLNEIMAQSGGIYEDEDGDDSDWIEIRNAGNTPADLGGYYLTDDPDVPAKWLVPPAIIQPGDFFVLFASGKDRAANGEFHTNFALDAGGDYLAIIEPDGQAVHDEIAGGFPAQEIGISYGTPSGGGARGYFAEPTPGADNGADAFGGFVREGVAFDQPRGFYEDPIEVGLSTLADGAAIYYTTDGSVPSPSGGTLYSAPVPVAATTVLRAGAFRPGEVPLRIATRTFLFLDDILAQPALPAGYPGTWQPGVAADYAMDASVGTAAEIKAALRALPTVSVVMPIDDLFNPSTDPAVGGMYSNSTIARGREWERRCSAEFFDFPHGQEIQLDCGARIFGNASRATSRSKHNMRLAFRRAYGAPNLEFPVFGGDAHPEKVNGYLLRGQNGDSWFHPAAGQRQEALYIRDQVARSAHAAMDRPETRQDHVHLYLNGLYWGVFNTIERIEDNAMAERFGGADEEWDVIKSSRVAGMEVVSGSLDQWREVQALAEAGVAGDAEYAAIQEFLDLPNMIDFLLVNFYNGNSDWDDNNFQAARRRVPGDKWRFFVWDSERTLLSPTANNTGLNHADRVTRLHTMLRQNAEYRLLFADRIHQHFFNGGILTPDGMRAEFNRWVEFLRGPLLAESARWGDNYRAGNPYTVGGEWQAEVDYMNNTYMAGRTDTVLAQLAAQGLYPAVAAPSFNQHGGDVPAGFSLDMSAPAGAIYYTLDGSDPRDSSLVFTAPIRLEESARVNARALDGGVWSALNSAVFFVEAVPASAANLVVSEIHYHPPGDDDGLEFLELMNIGAQAVNLGGVRLIDGVNFDFDQDATLAAPVLAPGARLILAGDPAQFAAAYPGAADQVAGKFIGDLSNSGERLVLVAADGSDIRAFRYNDKSPWPEPADGDAFSLTLIAPESNPDHALPGSWRPSAAEGGSPGASDAVLFDGDPGADGDGDLLTAFAEHALGTSDADPDGSPLQIAGSGGGALTLTYTQNLAADDAAVDAEFSEDLTAWADANAFLQAEVAHLGGGIALITLRQSAPLPNAARLYFRLKVARR